MKKFVVTEEEKIRIINLHKKLVSEQTEKETEGQVSLGFFEKNKLNELPSEATKTSGGSSSGPKNCPPETDSETIKKFEDETKLLTYPGDKNYRYLKIENDWFAKNINNKKVFNITKCGYTSSVEKLNKEFPTETGTTTSSETGTTTSNTRGAKAAIQQYFNNKFK
jgi:hypothetical protein